MFEYFKATCLVFGSFLDTFQRIADCAANTRGFWRSDDCDRDGHDDDDDHDHDDCDNVDNGDGDGLGSGGEDKVIVIQWY